MKYLTRWRMHKAIRLLKNEVKVEKIAEQLGYESQVAFRKAFKRGLPFLGRSPSPTQLPSSLLWLLSKLEDPTSSAHLNAF